MPSSRPSSVGKSTITLGLAPSSAAERRAVGRGARQRARRVQRRFHRRFADADHELGLAVGVLVRRRCRARPEDRTGVPPARRRCRGSRRSAPTRRSVAALSPSLATAARDSAGSFESITMAPFSSSRPVPDANSPAEPIQPVKSRRAWALSPPSSRSGCEDPRQQALDADARAWPSSSRSRRAGWPARRCLQRRPSRARAWRRRRRGRPPATIRRAVRPSPRRPASPRRAARRRGAGACARRVERRRRSTCLAGTSETFTRSPAGEQRQRRRRALRASALGAGERRRVGVDVRERAGRRRGRQLRVARPRARAPGRRRSCRSPRAAPARCRSPPGARRSRRRARPWSPDRRCRDRSSCARRRGSRAP